MSDVNPADPFGLIGQVLDGQFRVDKFVGEGGFSIVYRGFHAGLNEPIAIKCLKLPPALGSALVESFIRRFRDESRIHYRLSQGNLAIARSIASGTTMSSSTSALVPYMVLEWLDGRSLGQDFEVRRESGATGRSMDEVVKLLDSAAQGLAFAHAQGVVHRDMNPGNLFLAERQQSQYGVMTKVLDFGVAKVISDHALELGPRAQTLGQIRIFAPAYGSPEQFDDSVGKVGPQSDVYSFALIVLEALRDFPVRNGEHLGEFAMMALDPAARPTPRSLGVPVGDAVEDVFKRAAALRPEERPMDMGQFWGGLKHAIRADAESGKPPHADSVPSRPGSAWKPRPPAAGQAPPDRPVTADMPAPVVEVARPGSIAPAPIDPGRSQALRGTVRMNPGPSGATPLTSTLVMDSRAHTPPPQPAAKPALNATVALASPFAQGQGPGKGPAANATMVMGSNASFEAARTMAGSAPTVAANDGHPGFAAARARADAASSPPATPAPPPMRAEVSTVVPPQPKSSGKVIAIVGVLLLLLGVGGFFAYRAMQGGADENPNPHVAKPQPSASAAAPNAPASAAPAETTGGGTTPPAPDEPAATAATPADTTPRRTSRRRESPPAMVGAEGAALRPRGPGRRRALPRAVRLPRKRLPRRPNRSPPQLPRTRGGSIRNAAKAALDVMNGVLASCRSSGGKTGDGTISVTFNPDGHADRAVVDEPPFVGTPEGACVSSRFKQAKIAPFEGSPGTVAYTFHIPN